jgi:hypothetical protein
MSVTEALSMLTITNNERAATLAEADSLQKKLSDLLQGIPFPNGCQGPFLSKDRIGLGELHVPHPVYSFFGRHTAANIPMLVGRVGTDDKEIPACLYFAMPSTGRQDDNITGLDFESVSILAAQHQLGVPACKAEHFMRRRMVMVKIVNAVAPLRRPTITLELRFEECSRVAALNCDGVPIEQDRQVFIVGHPTVAGKLDHNGRNRNG